MPPTAISSSGRPTWQLPPGVTRGTWAYSESPTVALTYDDYFALNSLFDFDEQVLAHYFTPAGLVADLGCGTGRALVPVVRQGHHGLAIDLSPHMLAIVRDKAAQELLPIHCLRANLVDLDAVRDGVVDHAMCLFSTLGMIHGRENRHRMLAHVRRIVRPGGRFVLHVHNFWFNLWDPGGPWWLLGNLASGSLLRSVEVGDKYFQYRGVPNMYLHVFRAGELRRIIHEAGFRILDWIPLDVVRRHPLRRPWLIEGLRANGWIIVCE